MEATLSRGHLTETLTGRATLFFVFLFFGNDMYAAVIGNDDIWSQ